MMDLSENLYLIYGKIRKLKVEDLKDSRYSDILADLKKELGKSTINLEVLSHNQAVDAKAFLEFNDRIFEIKKNHVYNK